LTIAKVIVDSFLFSSDRRDSILSSKLYISSANDFLTHPEFFNLIKISNNRRFSFYFNSIFDQIGLTLKDENGKGSKKRPFSGPK
jgi:hypothetical protein